MLARRRIGHDDPIARDLTRIIDAGERAAALTQQLLAFSRSQVPRNELLDLNHVIEQTARLIERVIGDDIELHLDFATDAGSVRADRTQIEQILMNLAVNARDAMPDGGSLRISTRRDGADRVVLAVSDTGVGMDEATRARAMEPFFTTKGERGSGLGLSTVYGIVVGAGGAIALDNQPGYGCTIRIALPRDVDPAAPRQAAAQPEVVGRGSVLVAEHGAECANCSEKRCKRSAMSRSWPATPPTRCVFSPIPRAASTRCSLTW
jgi:signal transduction histidine kinase